MGTKRKHCDPRDPSDARRGTIGTPAKLYLGIVKHGQTAKKPVQVVANKESAFKVVYAVSDVDGLVGQVVEPDASKGAPGALEVEFRAPSKPGTYRGTLSITTVPAGSSTLSLPVVVCVSDGVAVFPEAVAFGSIPKGQAVEKTIEVKCSSGSQLKAVTAKPDALAVSIGSPDGSGAIPITLAVKKETQPGPFAGELQLEFTGQEKANLVVPFAGEVLPK